MATQTPTPIKLRTQNDGLSDMESLKPYNTITTPVDETPLVRQEFKDESDINWLLKRHSILPQTQSAPTFGVVNFDDDLTTAFEKVQQAKDAYDDLPPDVKKLYPSWQSLAQEIALGDSNPALGETLAQELATEAKTRAEAAAAAQERKQNPPAGAGGSSPDAGGGSPSGARQN